ncbi:MAG: DegT/DnrJ/EryC1/StrS family aminotransferase [Motiliproteus sp.]|nr:DegT/DnrJ/EryC1/StrS family aminotransferase [Motiliproteus sp.]MCW9053452.1 DegT/DnrJ/EryC1/StrS family aminotransferase [Motiliproteus sp.]
MLPLATTTWDEDEYAALQRVIDSGMFSMGENVADFEKAFAEFMGSQFCIMVNSGSSANLIAVASLFFRKENPLKAGDEVIVPAVSWSTTYYPLQQYGLKLKFVDVDKDTLNLDIAQVEQAITDRTRAIFSVNLLGNPVDYPTLQALVADKDILILEDNCESMGSTLDGKQAGTFGLMGTYSGFFSHHISTMEGGMVCTDDEELYHIMLSIRSHGWTRHLPDDNLVCEKSNDPFQESFRFVLPGYNLRPLDMSGALGLAQLKKLPSIVEGRQNNAKDFRELFGGISGIQIQQETGQSSWFGFALLVDGGVEKRNVLVETLTKAGVECRPIVAGNFVRNPVIKYFDYSVHGDLDQSNRVHDSGLFIGNHHYSIRKQLQETADLVASALG